ncbi:hypothetical protein AX16_002223 [Volvariella volvacea WC 439]|nr:hypothetical protein AX16_002223 [Volvariella volvacea WC 439]
MNLDVSMLLISLFLVAFAQSLASPVPISVPGSTIPSPVCIVAAAATTSQCDPTRTRTLFDILYSCIGVIVLCTYISMHHNIPDQEGDQGSWKRGQLAKAVVVVQTTWFIAQCIARRVEGLILTEIELVTLAFATLNVITYGLWWDKPLNVGYPIYFDENGTRSDGPQEMIDELEESDVGRVKEWSGTWYERLWRSTRDCFAGCAAACQSFWRGMKESWEESREEYGMWAVFISPFSAVFFPLAEMAFDGNSENRRTSVHPFYAAGMDEESNCLAILYGSVIGILFGGIHLVGWNFTFLTITELWLWRDSSLVLTVVPLLVFVMPTAFVGAPLYFAARIILLFLAFFTLRDLPDSAYQNVRWTEYLPISSFTPSVYAYI